MHFFEPVAWQDHTPRSDRFNDIYRSRYGALRQSTDVFLAGCGLPQRWHLGHDFTVLETGFGLGLNFLTTWATWLHDPQACQQLRYVSVEAFPVSAHAIRQSTQALATEMGPQNVLAQQLLNLVEPLTAAWPTLQPGLNQWTLNAGHKPPVQLVLLAGNVVPMLQLWSGRADAVYLDGFSPARNPDMWSETALHEVARHCQPGTRLATYTVAAQVRHHLATLGFQVNKCQGVPPKRDRLEATMLKPHLSASTTAVE